MALIFDGFVLRKPRVAGSNDPFTDAPDIVVLDRDSNASGTSDRDAYLADDRDAQYAVVPHATSNLVEGTDFVQEQAVQIDDDGLVYSFNSESYEVKNVSATPPADSVHVRTGVLVYNSPPGAVSVTYQREKTRVHYMRNDNDEVRRFSYEASEDRWMPLPGSSPTNIGTVPNNGLMELPVVEEAGDPRVVIGSPNSSLGFLANVEKIFDETTFESYVNNPSTIPSGTDAVVFVETGELQFEPSVISTYLQQNVFSWRYSYFDFEASTGFLGVSNTDDLVLNPLPIDPATSDLHRPLIRAGFGTWLDITPVGGGGADGEWDPATGQVILDASYDGQDIYYDGVFINQTPIDSFDEQDLGTISPDFSTSSVSSPVDLSTYDLDGLILYVEETGEAIRQIKQVDSLDPSHKIPDYRVQINDSGDLRLSYQFAKDNDGLVLKAATGDFYLENGLVFRMYRSPVNLDETGSQPDVIARRRNEDETIIEGISPGAFAGIPQVPLDDIAGEEQNTFFLLRQGVKRTLLEQDKDIIYDFNERRFLWADSTTEIQNITSPETAVDLSNSVLHDQALTVELDTGQGYVTQNLGEDILLDRGAGQVTFVNEKGGQLYRGFASVSATSLVAYSDDFTGITIPPDDEDKPLVIINEQDVYRIVGQPNPDELELSSAIPSSANVASYRVIEAGEKVFKYQQEAIDFGQRDVFPYLLFENPSFVPDGEDFAFEDNAGNPLARQVLESESLGELQNAPLFIPSYFRNTNSVFDLYRQGLLLTDVSPATPSATGEYSVNVSTGEVTFYGPDITNFPDNEITFVPSLSTGRTSGPVEVLQSDRSIGLPSSVTDFIAKVQLAENEYEVLEEDGTLFFNDALPEDGLLEVRYRTDSGFVTENVGFSVREELSLSTTQTIASFGSLGTIDTSRPARLLINGAPNSNATFDLTAPEVVFDPIFPNRKVEVEYHVLEAPTGQITGQLLNPVEPFDVVFGEGRDQTLTGDFSSDLQDGDLLFIEGSVHLLSGISYNTSANETSFELAPGLIEVAENPETFVTNRAPDFSSVPVTISPVTIEDESLFFVGDQRDEFEIGKVLLLDGDAYQVTSTDFNEFNSATEVVIEAPASQSYDSPTVSITDKIVYGPDTEVLGVDSPGVQAQGFDLVRFDEGTNEGSLLTENVDYSYFSSGSLVLDPANTDLPEPNDLFYFAYTARRTVEPIHIGPTRIIPRLRTTYTYQINATAENGIENSDLLATYTFYAPDTFFFRKTSLDDFSGEQVDLIEQEFQDTTSSGPLISFGGGQKIYEKGGDSLIWQDGDLRDQDRVGRAFIDFFHQTINQLENYLQILDGRVLGDSDGRFNFVLGPDDQPGGEDAVTGELIPYYVNPDDPGDKPTSDEIDALDLSRINDYVQNDIDDLVLITKKPYDIGFETPVSVPPSFDFVYEGTFLEAWKPSRFSRFYPEETDIFTITLPSRTGGGSYQFPQDFLRLLADLGPDDFTSIANIKERSARAWVIDSAVLNDSDGQVLDAGMLFEQNNTTAYNDPSGANLETGDPDRYIPAFETGDLVKVGRTEVVFFGSLLTEGTGARRGPTSPNDVFFDDGTTDFTVFSLPADLQIGTSFYEVVALNNGSVETAIPIEESGTVEYSLRDGQEGSFVQQRRILAEGLVATNVDTGQITLDADSSGGAPDSSIGSGETISLQKNDTIWVESQTYFRSPRDLWARPGKGEFLNTVLPGFIANIINQEVPDPTSYLEATVAYNNTRLDPFRFPALDGDFLNDDFDQEPPYVNPINQNEISLIGDETTALTNMLDLTAQGFVINGTVINGHTIDVGLDLTNYSNSVLEDSSQPYTYDRVLLEGVVDGGGNSLSYRTSGTTATELLLAAFETEEANVLYEITAASSSSLFDGTGTRTASAEWTDDGSFDFTVFSGANTLFLNVGGSQYTINTINNGFVTTTTSISETSGSYTISGTGFGDIGPDLYEIQDSNMDFSFAKGQVTISSGPNLGVYEIDENISGPNELFVDAFDTSQAAASSTTTAAVSPAGYVRAASGSRDVTNLDQWNDGSTFDFTAFSNWDPLYLVVVTENGGFIDGNSVYEVDSVQLGSVTVTQNINESAGDYYLTTSQGFAIVDATVDLTSGSDRVYFNQGTANYNIRAGDQLVIDSTSDNGGLYEVLDVDLGSSPASVQVDRNLETTEALITSGNFPLKVRTYRPRRKTSELETEVRQAGLSKYPLYRDPTTAPTTLIGNSGESIASLLDSGNYTIENPSAPSLDVLEALVGLAFESRSSDTDGEIALNSGTYELSSSSVGDWVAAGVETDDYVLIENGDSIGFYQAGTVTPGTIEILLPSPNEFALTFSRTVESGLEFRVLNSNRFTDRTAQFLLYEYLSIITEIRRIEALITASFHAPDDFLVSDTLQNNPGDLENSNIQNNHIDGLFTIFNAGAQVRSDWITSAGSSARNEIFAILEGTEALYDQRFAWIDFRINREDGTLARRQRFKEQRAKREAKILKQLLKLKSSQ